MNVLFWDESGRGYEVRAADWREALWRARVLITLGFEFAYRNGRPQQCPDREPGRLHRFEYLTGANENDVECVCIYCDAKR